MTYRGSPIRGRASAKQGQMEAVVLRRNPGAPPVASHYLRIGQELDIRGDIAFAQALLETNFFRFGGLVQPWQNNYGGLGATGPDQPGASFATPEEGVLAHLQHLYAYATTEPLPDGTALVDPRFHLVQRGSASHVGDLTGRWAMATNYGEAIDRILGEILVEPVPGDPYQITPAFLDASSQNRPGACTSTGCWQGAQGIVVHRTASPTMNARAIRDYFNRAPDGRYASSQFVLDNEEILQLMPVGEVAYHTIGKNYTHLGIETCEHNWGTDQWQETYRRLVWLAAHLSRSFQLDIADLTGHFWWDPVNRPYDPTHLGWKEADGRATGLFSWNRFIADVQAHLSDRSAAEPGLPPVERISVKVARTMEFDCADGLLINSTTYVPVRQFAACLVPNSAVHWQEAERRILVELPPSSVASAGQGAAVLAPAPKADPGPVSSGTAIPVHPPRRPPARPVRNAAAPVGEKHKRVKLEIVSNPIPVWLARHGRGL